MVRTAIQLIGIFVIAGILTVWSCSTENNADTPLFDSSKAFEYLTRQVSFGPRVPGTSAHNETSKWIASVLREHTTYVSYQSFSGVFGGFEVKMKNIMASFYPDKKKRVLLCAHWDSRHHADKDPDSTKWNQPVPGANDGASGVAVLLEIAAIIKDKEPPSGVDIVFFDGEDGGEYGNNETWLLGSRYFAKVMPSSYNPEYAILLDMIGDKDLALSRDSNSMYAAPLLWERMIMHCKSVGIAVSSNTIGVLDDHVPLIERGIPSIDLIDFDYPYWHTVSDTPDKCSPESLGKIGELVLKILYEEQ
jgi:Zn-dependent M28 family amino/carboxypeptidase